MMMKKKMSIMIPLLKMIMMMIMTKSKKILNIATAVVVGLLIACTIASFAIRAATQPKV